MHALDTRRAFHDAAGRPLDLFLVVGEITRFIREDDRRKYTIIVGSDSEGISDDGCDFVTAIVVHRIGNGGRYFWRRLELPRLHTLRDRILQEVLLSIDIARELFDQLEAMDIPPFGFEIHVDVGENGETRAMLQEVLGMVRAYNFEAKTKPESYAASKVADRYV